MKRNLLEQAAGFIKRQRNRQRWYKVFSVMAAVVVFVTTYALILPAITMERPAICGMEAHVHTADCYARTADGYACMADLQLHTHTDACYDEQENLVCGYADFVLHTHNEFCYDADGNLVCPLDEVTSYTVEQPVLAEEETGDAATGSALAFIMEELHGDTIEYTEPHAHSEDCYDEAGRLVCGQLEVQAHQHDATCLADDARICELEEHQHTDACYETEDTAEQQPDADTEYICGMEEHTHGESCYDEAGELICGLEEHQHSEACSSVSEEQLPDAELADTESGDSTTEQSPDEAVEYICGLEAHSHDEACYNENGELICILSEHTHSEACGTIAENETPLAAVEPSVFTAEDDKVVVTVTVPAGVQLPEGSKLEIKPLAADGDDYQATVQAGEELLRQAQPQANILQHLVYDISLVCDGVEIEPEGGAVEVCISLKPNTLLTEEPSATVQVYHMAQEPELLETEVESEADGTVNVNFATESFSEYGIMLLSTENSVSQPTTEDTLETIAGADAYTMEYLLTQYNVISFGDIEMNIHCMGGVLIKGDFSGVGSGFSDSANVNAPSYIQGYVSYNGPHNSRNNKSGVNLYVGTKNTVGSDKQTLNGKLNFNPGGDIYITDTFVDWNQIESIVQTTSQMLSKASSQSITVEYNWQEIGVQAGTSVTVNTGGNKVAQIKIVGTSEKSTVINLLGDSYSYIPKITQINNQSPQASEDGDGMSIVLNFPDATFIRIPSDCMSVFGHVLAPNAQVIMDGGNYNGCVVCKNGVIGAEGHLWPYTGGKLIPAKEGFRASKTVDGKTPTATEQFTFYLEKLQDGQWVQIQDTKNVGKDIIFDEISYAETGTCWYRIYEKQDPVVGYQISKEESIIKVEVTEVADSDNNTSYKAETTYYKVKDEAVPEAITFTSHIKDNAINMEELEAVVVAEGETYDFIFGNTTTPTDIPDYTLPETGGSGILSYILAGLLLMAAATMLLYKQKQRGREEL